MSGLRMKCGAEVVGCVEFVYFMHEVGHILEVIIPPHKPKTISLYTSTVYCDFRRTDPVPIVYVHGYPCRLTPAFHGRLPYFHGVYQEAEALIPTWCEVLLNDARLPLRLTLP